MSILNQILAVLVPDALATAATTTATAATTAAPAAQANPNESMMSWVFLLFGFGLIYFLLWRPQAKRAKEHRSLISSLGKGDEIVTNSGILGKVVKVNDNFITVAINDGTEVIMQKSAVAAIMPKGTIKSHQDAKA